MIANHPLRAAISDEMHVRRLPRFAAPCRLMQIVTVVGEKDGDAARRHVEALAQAGRVTVPIAGKYGVLALGDVTLVWEGHTEFASYTLLRSGASAWPISRAPFRNADRRMIGCSMNSPFFRPSSRGWSPKRATE